MKAKDRVVARRNLDKRLNLIREFNLERPPRGWIKSIREALGMTTRQLAQRIGVGQSRAFDIEKAETTGAITLESLQRAARALDCKLVYALVPHKSLETMIEERATALAKRRVKTISHTMALENQSLEEEVEREQIIQLARQLIEASGSRLWNDE